MSSSPFDATIELAPHASLRALTILFWLHAAALGAMVYALRSGPVLAVLAGLVALSWVWTRRHPVFGFGPRALTRLTWHAAGGWTLHDSAGGTFEADLDRNSLVHERLLVLNFRVKAGGTRSRALLGDELDAETLRRLRARLAAGQRR